MCKDDAHWESNKCCDQGPQGPAGLQGPQGIQGTVGPQGIVGQTGMQGAQGLQGAKGDPGKDCDCTQTTGSRYANVYATVPQIVGAYSSSNDMVLFDAQNAVSTGDFDLSGMNSTGDMKFLKHGIYNISWLLQARITSPVPNPTPSWSFGFWLNGVLVPGSIYSGFTQAPGDDACHSSSELIIEVKAGDVLRLRNTSISSVNLNPSVTGSVFPITIASINIVGLKDLP